MDASVLDDFEAWIRAIIRDEDRASDIYETIKVRDTRSALEQAIIQAKEERS